MKFLNILILLELATLLVTACNNTINKSLTPPIIKNQIYEKEVELDNLKEVEIENIQQQHHDELKIIIKVPIIINKKILKKYLKKDQNPQIINLNL
ncbi:hypothetical protein [Spiroplasma endosymbiont of Agriotes lineatus]|uniref:hypothetical protein n=1 Tax=Spiroplasma endosymbiont of Agriotes lineatus TaxID=3077930 RepID=UPI0030CEEF60